MRFAKVGERVRVLNNKNGAYKNMTGEVIRVLTSGLAVVDIDFEFHKNLKTGYSHTPNIQFGNYEILAESISTLEVE